MANTKTRKSVKKVNVKKNECPCGCCAWDSVKYTRVWAAWRAFWCRGFTEWAGTSSRSEYWLSWVGNLIIFVVLGLLVGIVALVEMHSSLGQPGLLTVLFGIVLTAYVLACVIPAISMMTRRMHDAGLSAWLWLIYALSVMPEVWGYGPCVGIIVALLPTQVHNNLYHKNNK